MDKNKDNRGDLQITSLFLKSFSNKFDLETIFILNLSNSSIVSLGALEECTNLLLLDLSSNGIKDLAPLQKLNKLQILKLGKNFITNIEPLKENTKLVQVDLHGNQIKSLKSLAVISGNKFLTTIYLQLLSGTFKNPCCDDNNYRETIFDIVKSLKRLDGVKKGMKFSIGELGKVKAQIKFEMKNTTDYWYTKDFPKVESSKPIKLDDHAVMKSINSVNDLIKKIESQLK